MQTAAAAAGRRRFWPFAALFLFLLTTHASAQSGRVVPKPTPADDQIRVYTEEVRLPVYARDEYGRFDPTLEIDDIVVLEDNVKQQVRSIRRIPASVVLVLATGGELNPAQRTRTTREAALSLLSQLRAGDAVAVMQFDRKIQLIQPWTIDRDEAAQTLRKKLWGASGARPAEALQQAALLFADQPVGNRHLVFVTDGVETPGAGASPAQVTRVLEGNAGIGGRGAYAEAVKRLMAAQVSVHIISYSTFGFKESKEKAKNAPLSNAVPGSVKASGVATAGIDPTMPSTMNRGGAVGPSTGAVITFDPAMRRMRKAYERALQRGEETMKTLAADTGGRLWIPLSAEDLALQGSEVAREIGTQYVVTYTPTRPLALSPETEMRRVVVLPRRNGLQVRTRRVYVTAAALQRPPEAKAEVK
ncbi:MAG: von Willebrand factor type domain [Pyrinomonadaceae bacterium]|jgi:VWFA-related protein|nr:von Willebrand factor type domain [Pyrinomonadaceae bacterium]